MKLLLVDDDKMSIDILAKYINPHLPSITGVFTAYNGKEALKIIKKEKPEIIITDIKMPVMNGLELLHEIKEINNYLPKSFIISGYSDFEYAKKALSLNVIDYILKPIDEQELIDKINNLYPTINTNRKSTFEDVEEYIKINISKKLLLKDIAELFFYNPAYLGRLIKKKTGLSCNDYITSIRIVKAKNLLKDTVISIKAISSEVGFNDPEYFSNKFKQFTKLTPTEYREKTHTI